jgi:hypothetical protein
LGGFKAIHNDVLGGLAIVTDTLGNPLGIPDKLDPTGSKHLPRGGTGRAGGERQAGGHGSRSAARVSRLIVQKNPVCPPVPPDKIGPAPPGSVDWINRADRYGFSLCASPRGGCGLPSPRVDHWNPEDRKPGVAGLDRDLSGLTGFEAKMRWEGHIPVRKRPGFGFSNEDRYAGNADFRRAQAFSRFPVFANTNEGVTIPPRGHLAEIKDDGFGTDGMSLRWGGGSLETNFLRMPSRHAER